MVPSITGILGGFLLLTSLPLAVADSVWDYAPDFSKDPIQPYPDLKKPDGTNISVENIRGTHLFGFRGCAKGDADNIKQAYKDFHTLADQLDVYNNIDWTSDAANDFWGPTTGDNVVPENTRKEIQRKPGEAFDTTSSRLTNFIPRDLCCGPTSLLVSVDMATSMALLATALDRSECLSLFPSHQKLTSITDPLQ
jgi:hypothetical protein